MPDDPWLKTAKRFDRVLYESGIPFCFIGGVAVQCWGEPRGTRDVDAAVYAPLGEKAAAVKLMPGSFTAAEQNSFEKARVTRVLLLQEPDEGVGIDVSLAAAQFKFDAIERSVRQRLAPGVSLRVCGPEGLIVYKAFAGRPIDWRDVEGILIRQQGRLDFELVEANLRPLCDLKENPDLFRQYEVLRDRYR